MREDHGIQFVYHFKLKSDKIASCFFSNSAVFSLISPSDVPKFFKYTEVNVEENEINEDFIYVLTSLEVCVFNKDFHESQEKTILD